MYNVTSTNTKEKGDWISHVSLQPGHFRGEVVLAGATAPEPLPVRDLVEADLWSQLPADLADGI